MTVIKLQALTCPECSAKFLATAVVSVYEPLPDYLLGITDHADCPNCGARVAEGSFAKWEEDHAPRDESDLFRAVSPRMIPMPLDRESETMVTFSKWIPGSKP